MVRKEPLAKERFHLNIADDLRLPDFAIIDGSRCGTQWLRACLIEHPQVYLTPDVNEIFFDRYFDHGIQWYARLFRGHGGQCRVATSRRPILPILSRRGGCTTCCLRRRCSCRCATRSSARGPGTCRCGGRAISTRAWASDSVRDRARIVGDGECSAAPVVDAVVPGRAVPLSGSRGRKADPFAHLRRVYDILGVDPEFRAPSTTEKVNEHQTPRSLVFAKVAFRAARLVHHHNNSSTPTCWSSGSPSGRAQASAVQGGAGLGQGPVAAVQGRPRLARRALP